METVKKPDIALVTGGTGAVGSVLVRLLLEEGLQVRVLAIDPAPGGALPGMEFIRGDINDRNVVAEAASGAGLVFHLAAKLHVNNPGPEVRDEYERVNVAGTRLLLEAAEKAGAERFVFFSTINVYGSTPPGRVYDEETPLNPGDYYADSKARAEELVHSAMPATVLRLAAVYGPGMKGNYRRMAEALHKGRFLPVGSGRNRRTLVYEKDAAAAALAAARHLGSSGRTFNVTDGEVHTLKEITASICSAMRRRYPLFHLPLPIVTVGCGLVEGVYRLARRQAPVNRALVQKLVEDVAVSGKRIQEELGYRPRYDLDTGWWEIVTVCQSAGGCK